MLCLIAVTYIYSFVNNRFASTVGRNIIAGSRFLKPHTPSESRENLILSLPKNHDVSEKESRLTAWRIAPIRRSLVVSLAVIDFSYA
ncbi:hypothetical protein CDAR_12211 [Caerostris darwini]|uniref:Uncharacterized protein n=1 Tax=Caerostris darwini TaxID=1538125 RepID=A0AAV4VG59_9ARAC|nr:hypothetical protein CDAR_12211 [Caerostris darwini]